MCGQRCRVGNVSRTMCHPRDIYKRFITQEPNFTLKGEESRGTLMSLFLFLYWLHICQIRLVSFMGRTPRGPVINSSFLFIPLTPGSWRHLDNTKDKCCRTDSLDTLGPALPLHLGDKLLILEVCHCRLVIWFGLRTGWRVHRVYWCQRNTTIIVLHISRPSDPLYNLGKKFLIEIYTF